MTTCCSRHCTQIHDHSQMNVTTFFNTQDVGNIHPSYNVWRICRVSTADSPHNWQYLLLAHWLSQYISSIQNTPCITLSSDSNPAHCSDSNCTHPLTAYRQYTHHWYAHAPAYLPHHYIHFMKLSHTAVQWLKRHFYPTLVTAYVYEKANNKKEGRKEGRKNSDSHKTMIILKTSLTHITSRHTFPNTHFLVNTYKKIWGCNVLPLVWLFFLPSL
jgi:hypothetical protein